MVSDGVLLIQKLLKLFPFDAFCIAHEYNKLAAILQGKLGNAVLTDAEIGRCFNHAQKKLFMERNSWNRFFGVCITARQGTGIPIDVLSEVERSDKRGGVHIKIGAHEFSSFVIKVSVNIIKAWTVLDEGIGLLGATTGEL